MEFHRLSSDFYNDFGSCEKILSKEERPYYGLDYSKPVTIRQHEYNVVLSNKL